jgi:hypothetical protein
MPKSLQEKRFNAAVVTRGISSAPIYQTVLHLFKTLGLNGDCLISGPEPEHQQSS